MGVTGGSGGQGFIQSSETRDLTNENLLSYRRATFGLGALELLGGFSVQKFHIESVTGSGANFPTDATTIFNLGSGSQLSPAGSGVTTSTSDTNVGAGMVDNDLATRWSGNGDGAWARFDLGSVVSVGGDLCQGYLFARPDKPWTPIKF